MTVDDGGDNPEHVDVLQLQGGIPHSTQQFDYCEGCICLLHHECAMMCSRAVGTVAQTSTAHLCKPLTS
jgi:hypothetical protein